jgi:hypothetical protein
VSVKKQDFIITTPQRVIKGTIVKRDDEWVVEQIGLRFHSMLGLTAKELVAKCEEHGWKLERY